MKKFYILIFFSIFFFSQSLQLNALIGDKIILKVNNKIVTNFEVKNKVISTLILSNQIINQKNIDKIKSQTLESLIQLKLKQIALEKYNYKVDYKQIEDYLNSISGNNIDGLKSNFENNNADFEMFIDNIKTEFKWQRFIVSKYSSNIEINKNSVTKEVNQIISKKSSLKEFNISEIEILINNDDTDKKKLSNLKGSILNEGFDKTALKYSVSATSQKNGNLGWIKSNILSKNIYQVISKLKIGEISPPIKRTNSVIFLRLNDIRILKSKELNRSNLEQEIIDRKSNELFDLYSKSHLSKLKNSVFIEYK